MQEKISKHSPHRLVFMPNAGIAAFTSWEPTLKMLVNEFGAVVIITDYTEEAANMGLKELKKMVLREGCARDGIFGGAGEPVQAAGELQGRR